jgi:hypothetical protein
MLKTKFDPLQSNDWLLAKYYTIGLTPCNVSQVLWKLLYHLSKASFSAYKPFCTFVHGQSYIHNHGPQGPSTLWLN